MPQQGISFAGSFIGLPGAYYADNVSAALPITPPTTPPMVVVGYGWGPKPFTPTLFASPANFQSAMRGSPVAAYAPFIATPSPLLNGAQLITFIDVSANTQSQAALLTSGATTMTLMTSVLYGPPSNQLSYQVQAATTAGRKVILTDNYGGAQFIGDNLTVPFQLAYSGAATGAVTYTVTSGSFTASSPVAGESVTVPLGSGSFYSVSLLAEFLNGTPYWYASVLSATNGQLPSNFLTVTASVSVSVPVSGALVYSNVNAYLQDIAYWVNQFTSGLCTAVVSGATDNATVLPVTGAPTFFSGATGVPPTNSSYASGLSVALTTPGWTVFCDSNSLAVQALLAQHCITASSVPYGMWRRGFTGSSIGDTVSTTIANSRALDAIQMAYLYPGVYRINTVTGQNQLYGGLYAAAMAAAMATGNQIAIPLTNKPLVATGVELANAGQPLTTSQLIQLQNNGVMAVYEPQNTGVPTILSDVTTWEVDDNPENTASQQVACRYWLAYSMVNALQPYVGTIASPTTEVAILNAAKATLNALIYTGGASNGVLASWVGSSLQLVYNGDNQVAAVSFQATLVGQNRFITCYASILPLNFVITAASTTGG